MKNLKIMLIAVAGAAAITLTPVMVTSASAATAASPPVCTVMGPNAPDCVTNSAADQVHGSTGSASFHDDC